MSDTGRNPTLTVAAPAKLNLSLRVTARRPDGFHELETVMVKINLADTLQFSPREDGTLTLDVVQLYPRSLGRIDVPVTADNLVLKAAELLRQETGCRQGAAITLWKRIPAAAGLGGGSSDAALTLTSLNALWSLGLSGAELSTLAARLGSDIPFFVAEAAWALCTGRGECLEPLPIQACLPVVLAKPQSGLSTAAVYRGCVPQPDAAGSAELIAALRSGRIEAVARSLLNSLQAPAERLNPEVTALRRRFERLDVVGHQLTGSGSAYFGLCRDARQAQRYAMQLRQQGTPWAVAVTTRA